MNLEIRIFETAEAQLLLLQHKISMINMKKSIAIISLLIVSLVAFAQNDSLRILKAQKGTYFSLKSYKAKPLSEWKTTKELLPKPIYEDNKIFVELYYKAWELAFKNIYEPSDKNGFVSQYLDAAFNKNMFLWDGCFITMFSNYGIPYVPGIESLDNFYAKQFPDGEISREINRATGLDFSEWVNWENKPLFTRWGSTVKNGNVVTNVSEPVVYINREVPLEKPYLTLDALNHPILAWAELESYNITGNRERLKLIYLPLKKYYGALQRFLMQGNGLYVTDWASMDNSPRNSYILKDGTGIDISCEMVLFANNLKEIAKLSGNYKDTAAFISDVNHLSGIINEKMWNPKENFYYDLTKDEKFVPVKTIAGFWTLISGVATPERAALLEKELNNRKTFNRLHRVPSLAADQKYYSPLGDYWRGSIWPPTNTMIIRGLEKYNLNKTAYDIAMNHLNNVADVYRKTGTVWENYAADSILQGNNSRKDFVGWSGLAPILYFLEYGIGLKPNAAINTLTWNIRGSKKVGCENYSFNNHRTSLVAENDGLNGKSFKINIISDGNYTLIVNHNDVQKIVEIKKGEQILSF